jgi:hypothetical protein
VGDCSRIGLRDKGEGKEKKEVGDCSRIGLRDKGEGEEK